MDLLFSKYASPFIFLDGMIQTERFTEFVFEFLKIENERKDEQQLWEFYLHKVMDKSFNEFKEELESELSALNTSEEQLETMVQNSMLILNGFIPG